MQTPKPSVLIFTAYFDIVELCDGENLKLPGLDVPAVEQPKGGVTWSRWFGVTHGGPNLEVVLSTPHCQFPAMASIFVRFSP